MVDGIRKFAKNAGVPQKFMHTTTIAWTRLVATAFANNPTGINFSEWIQLHPELFNRNLLARYYSPGG